MRIELGTRKALGRFASSVFVLFVVLFPATVDASGSYTYDGVGRLTTALYDNGTCVAYSYDATGNRTAQTITAPSGAPQTPNWGSGTWGCFSWTAQ